MAEPFLSEIRIMSFGFAPKGWAQCNGQLLPINQNQALFSLLGTTYGGNGQTNFALPNLQGNVPIHMGSGHTLGEKAGSQSVTLSIAQIPTHTHSLMASPSNGNSVQVNNDVFAGALNVYRGPDQLTALNAQSVTSTGGNQAHLNMQPFLTLNFCIALQGIFPSQT
jgi:microcystin-dependent protein